MKVAVIDPSLFTLPYDERLCAGLRGLDHDVRLIGRPVPAGTRASQPIVELFYRSVERIQRGLVPGPLYLAAKGIDHIWSMARLIRELENWRPDIIHFQWLALPIVDRHCLNRLRRVAPVVLTVHDSDPFNGDPTSFLQRLGTMDAIRRVDHLIVHTEQSVQRLTAQRIPLTRISRVPHGRLDPCPRPPAQPASNAGSDDIVFLLLGKIKPYKGADILIEAFARMPESLRAKCRVHIAGQPYMSVDALVRLAERLGVRERVDLTPRFLTEEEMHDLFRASTVLAFPYRVIDSSGVLLASLSAGKPVVASAIGCFAELMQDGVHGRLVPPQDAAALATAMTELAGSAALRCRMGAAVAELANRIPSWEAIAVQTERVYRRMHATSAPGADGRR